MWRLMWQGDVDNFKIVAEHFFLQEFIRGYLGLASRMVRLKELVELVTSLEDFFVRVLWDISPCSLVEV